MKSILKLSFLLLLICCKSKPAVDEVSAAAKVGYPAPQFSLMSVTGKAVKLSDFKGKVVLLDFWATWCPPCRTTTPLLVKLNKKYKGKDFNIIGISLDDDISKVSPYLKREKVEHPVLYSKNSRVDQEYRIKAIPTFYILDKSGTIVKEYIGYDPSFEKEWEREINILLAKK